VGCPTMTRLFKGFYTCTTTVPRLLTATAASLTQMMYCYERICGMRGRTRIEGKGTRLNRGKAHKKSEEARWRGLTWPQETASRVVPLDHVVARLQAQFTYWGHNVDPALDLRL